MTITEDQRVELKKLFNDYQEVVDRVKEISAEKKAITEHFARVAEIKNGVAGKLLKALLKKSEGETPDEEEVIDGLLAITGGM